MPAEYKSVSEVAQAVGRSTAMVRRHAEQGKLAGSFKLGGHVDAHGVVSGGIWAIPARFADPAVYEQTIAPAGWPNRPAE